MGTELAPKIDPVSPYDRALHGYFGELGKTHYGVRFLQTALRITELEKLTLVADIPGSEAWPVRELFQRDIDTERVIDNIVPYFTKETKIKFFNPLSIVLLPMDKKQLILDSVVEKVAQNTEMIKDDTVNIFEFDQYYMIETPEKHAYWSSVKWNSHNVKLVAVDGQHRLSALKHLASLYQTNPDDPRLTKVEFTDWTIPIVLIIFPPSLKTSHDKVPSLLDNMRDIFVTINTEAQKPNHCRTILLDDNSINRICCQEFLDYCHSDKNAEIPLIFFDWRAHDKLQYPQNAAPFMRVEELEAIHIHYLLGWDEDRDEQFRALSVKNMKEPIFEDEYRMYQQIRKRYRDVMMPSIIYILKNLKPIKGYIEFLKNVEKRNATPIQTYALSALKFGIHHGPPNVTQEIDKELESLKEQCKIFKDQKIPELFGKLIGLRGVFSGFTGFMNSYNSAFKDVIEPLKAAELYVLHINKAIENKLLDKDCSHLKWICIDRNDEIIHYKYEEQHKALGAYCALLACSYTKQESPKLTDETETYLSTLEGTLQSGYRREVKPGIKDKNPNATPAELRAMIKKASDKMAETHVKKLRSALGLNA